MKVSVGGVFKDVASIKVSPINAWKAVANTKAAVGGVWKVGETFTVPLSVSLSDISPQGRDRTNVGFAVTNSVTATPSGGVLPYAYSWALLSGVGVADSPNSASTTFTGSVSEGESLTGTFRVTVTDAFAQTVTADLAATFNGFVNFGD